MKTNVRKNWMFAVVSTLALLITATTLTVKSQTSPVLTIKAAGTNGLSISFTNNIGANSYDILWTPTLTGPDYSWTWAAIGAPGQTNFLVGMSSDPNTFYRALLDTNDLWSAANPTNLALGPLGITIDSPLAGTTFN